MFDRDDLRRLATADTGAPVVSVYARTDPRDPSNTSATPAWHIRLRHGLRAIAEQLETGDDREAMLAFRTLGERIESELIELPPASWGRSIAWFVGAGGAIDQRMTLQLPVAHNRVVWDALPFVSPLLEVADHGAPSGVVLVDGEYVRLLHIEQGEVQEPENSLLEIELGDWHAYGGTMGGSPERGTLKTSHHEQYEARVDEQRQRLFEQAAGTTSRRLQQLGWERIVLIAEASLGHRFQALLPAQVSERIVATLDQHLTHEDPGQIAAMLEDVLEGAWRSRTEALIADIVGRAKGGRAGALGLQETIGSLQTSAVAHLVFDPERDFASDVGDFPLPFTGPPELIGERLVEMAVTTDAQVTAISSDASEDFAKAGGVAALLRY
jgi:hypothetical protein